MCTRDSIFVPNYQGGRKLDIVFDAQHNRIKQGGLLDLGATHTLPSGQKLIEHDSCVQYAKLACESLSKNHTVHMLEAGTYRRRADVSNNIYKPDIYFACHLNSFPNIKTNYSLVEIPYNASPEAREFAKKLADSFLRHLPVAKSTVRQLNPFDRGYGCIGLIDAPITVLIEPLFINHPDSEKVLTLEPWRIAAAIVEAIEGIKS